jgi:hypothetical protein
MADPHHQHRDDVSLNDRLLDLFLYVPAGIAVSVVEDFPRLAERGRQRLGMQVSSARAVGQFAMRAGQHELRRRSESLLNRPAGRPDPTGRPVGARADGPRSAARGPFDAVGNPPGRTGGPVQAGPSPANGHVPAVSTLSIPGFDTLSASQVVQRLDGLNRAELVSVRAYEASTRGRRTILSRVDQLLDERS